MIKGVVVISAFWTKFFSAGRASAVTIFPFIFLREKASKFDRVLINHERIHITQAIELLIVPFYLLYLLEFVFRYVQYRNFKLAYFNISFEREAYHNQDNTNYFKTRKIWNFMQYLRD